MMDNILPEERLLRLIKGQAKDHGQRSDAGIEPLDPHTRDAKPGFERARRSSLQRYLYIFNSRRMTLAGFIISCAYLIFSFVYPVVAPVSVDLSRVAPEKAIDTQLKPSFQIKPLTFYLDSVNGHHIFGNAAQPEIHKAVNAQGSNVIKEINLVGVIIGDHPQAIIEDKNTQKTFYINKGQFIGEFQVEDIQEGKITVNHEGERYELYL